MEEGCLRLPGVHVEVERPVHVRVRAADEHGDALIDRGLRARGARDPARDRPPRRRADPRSHPRDQRKQAMRAMREAMAAQPARPVARRQRVKTVYLGTSDFAAAVLERLAGSAHRPALVVTRPDRPKGRGRQLQSPPVATRARELGLDARPARAAARRRVARADRRRRARRAVRVRLRRADQGAAALATTSCSTCIRRCCRAGAARRRSSGRSWPATRETGVSIMRLDRRARLRTGLPAGARADRPGRRLRHARRAAADAERRAAGARARRAPAVRRAGRGRASPTRTRSRRATASSTRTRPAAELERTVRALRAAHRRPRAAPRGRASSA